MRVRYIVCVCVCGGGIGEGVSDFLDKKSKSEKSFLGRVGGGGRERGQHCVRRGQPTLLCIQELIVLPGLRRK